MSPPIKFALAPTPTRAEDMIAQQFDIQDQLTLARKLYATTMKPDTYTALQGGLFFDLLLVNGTDKLLLVDGASNLRLASSSPSALSLIYAFDVGEPILYAGLALDNADGTDVSNEAIVFPKGFFRRGQKLSFTATGQITSNSTNVSLAFKLLFPHDGTEANVAMPTTVTADALGTWILELESQFGLDASGNGTVTHSGYLSVENTDETSGQSTALLETVLNTFDYQDVLYYLPQAIWSGTAADNDVDFHRATLSLQ